MKILVTGGAGFIGSHFVDMLVNGGHEVVVIDSFTYAGNHINDKAIYHNCKIEHEFARQLIASLDFHLLFNFAAETHVDRSIDNSYPFITTNVLGTQNLLEGARKAKLRFVQISTDEVYGSVESGAFTERSPLRPSNPYSASKASADLLCLSYARTYGLDVVITRCSNNYGERQHPEKLIPKCIERLNNGEKIQLYGSGLQKRDWIHVKDHCQGIWDAACKGRRGGIYNFGGDNCLSNRFVAHSIVQLYHEPYDCNQYIEYVDDRPGHDFAYKMDFSRASEDLGWEPTYSFMDGLRDLIGKTKKAV